MDCENGLPRRYAPRNDELSVIAIDSKQSPSLRHCERSEAIYFMLKNIVDYISNRL